jgi:hypothetical protein
MENEISDNIKILSNRISSELERLSSEPRGDTRSVDSLVYIGNWQDAIPRSIWVDKELDSREVRSWGIIRTQAIHSSAVMLSLNRLLTETLDYSNATVSRIIYVLRLTRWISLCSQLRTQEGQFKGNIYAIHDAPVSISDSIYLDKDYLTFVQQQISHKNKKISKLAESIWQGLENSVKNDSNLLQANSFELISNSIRVLSVGQSERSELNSHVQKLNAVNKNTVTVVKQPLNNLIKNPNVVVDNHVQNLNVATTCSSSSSSSSSSSKDIFNKKTTTTNSEGIYENAVEKKHCELIYPQEFNKNEIKLAQMYLKNIGAKLRQSFLDETAAQIINRKKTHNVIRNPVGYLSWLCNEYGKGNIYLTSLYLKHQELRDREEVTECAVEKKKQELIQAAKNKGSVAVNESKGDAGPEEIPFTDEEKKHSKKKRWGKLPASVRRRSGIDTRVDEPPP